MRWDKILEKKKDGFITLGIGITLLLRFLNSEATGFVVLGFFGCLLAFMGIFLLSFAQTWKEFFISVRKNWMLGLGSFLLCGGVWGILMLPDAGDGTKIAAALFAVVGFILLQWSNSVKKKRP